MRFRAQPRSFLSLLVGEASTRFVGGVAWTAATQVGALAIGMVTSVFTARLLGPSGRGVLTVAILVPTMLQLVVNAGAPSANVFLTGSRRFDDEQLARNSTLVCVGGSIIGSLVVLALALTDTLRLVIPHVATGIIALSMLSLPLLLLKGTVGGILHGRQQLRTIGLIEIIQAVILLVLTLVLLGSMHLGVSGAVAATVVSVFVGTAATMRATHLSAKAWLPQWDMVVLRPMLKYGLKGNAANLMQFFTYRLDSLIMNAIAGSSPVGIYSVSVRLGELLWLGPSAVSYAIFPKAARDDRATMDRFTPKAFWITAWLCLAGAVGMAAVGSVAVQALFGKAFSGAYLPLVTLLPGIVLLGAGSVLANEIAGRGHPGYNALGAVLTLMVTVTLDLILIPRHGATGAAAASTCAYTVSFLTAVGAYLHVSKAPLRTFLAVASPRVLLQRAQHSDHPAESSRA